MDNTFKAISANTVKLYKIEDLSDAGYDPVMVYRAIEKKRDDKPLSEEENDNCYKCFAICTILAINKEWPEKDDSLKNKDKDFQRSEGIGGFQQDMLQEVSIGLAKAYYENPEGNFLSYIKKVPETKADREHLHRHVSWKARKLIAVFMKNRDRDYFNLDEKRLDYEEKSKDGESKGIFGDKIIDDKYDTDDQFIRTDLDDYVISQHYKKSQIAKETQEILDNFFLKSQKELNFISSYFKNHMLVGLNPSDVWKFKLYEWDSVLLWDILQKIDIGELISSGEKKDLYLFYLMVCIFALYQKNQTVVMNPDLEHTQEVIIRKPYVNILAVLVIKTFLYYLNDLDKKVFSQVDDPPPTEYMEAKKFLNAIKYKPRDLLKKAVKLPPISVPKPKPVTTKPIAMKKTLNAIMFQATDDYEFPETLNIQDLFESYDVFKELTNKIAYSFEHGTLEHLYEDSDVTDALDNLKSFLSDNNIEISTIFNFLNPISQKESQDYDYIIQGAISAIATGIMSQFKKEDGKLQIILTKDENSLNSDMLAKATANFVKSMIERDFDIKSGDVSILAQGALNNFMKEVGTPFKVSIPKGSEYDSFRMMIDMNGPIKVAIPFTTQGDKPFWDDEKVLDDKMVQMVDKSITDKLNAAKIGKAILKQL
jgi:hypothetical protein